MTVSLITRNNERYTGSSLGEEEVIMDAEKSNFYGLNEMGTVIWKMLEEPMTYETLIDRLLSKYEVSRKVCETQTKLFLEKMLAQDMVRINR